MMKSLSTQMSINSPLYNERFVRGESIHLSAQFNGLRPPSSKSLRWSSNKDGLLGYGQHIVVKRHSLGTHTIRLDTTPHIKVPPSALRIFPDLSALYQTPPSEAEIDRIKKDFLAFQWVDGAGAQEQWNAYPSIYRLLQTA